MRGKFNYLQFGDNEMKQLLSITFEYGWGHSGVESWGGNWQVRACNEALEQIRTRVAMMTNLGELETFSKSDIDQKLDAKYTSGKSASSIEIGLGNKQNEEAKEKWVNANNLVIAVDNVQIKDGTAWTKTKDHPFRGRSWVASATMLCDIKIYGKE